jgi:hypothetical protein
MPHRAIAAFSDPPALDTLAGFLFAAVTNAPTPNHRSLTAVSSAIPV